MNADVKRVRENENVVVNCGFGVNEYGELVRGTKDSSVNDVKGERVMYKVREEMVELPAKIGEVKVNAKWECEVRNDLPVSIDDFSLPTCMIDEDNDWLPEDLKLQNTMSSFIEGGSSKEFDSYCKSHGFLGRGSKEAKRALTGVYVDDEDDGIEPSTPSFYTYGHLKGADGKAIGKGGKFTLGL